MDKNTIIGLCLMFLVIMGFTWLNQPSDEELAAAKAQQEQAEAKTKQQTAAEAAPTAADTQMLLDLDLFRRHIAPALGATVRFVGTEPTDQLTRIWTAMARTRLRCWSRA